MMLLAVTHDKFVSSNWSVLICLLLVKLRSSVYRLFIAFVYMLNKPFCKVLVPVVVDINLLIGIHSTLILCNSFLESVVENSFYCKLGI